MRLLVTRDTSWHTLWMCLAIVFNEMLNLLRKELGEVIPSRLK